MSAILDYSSTNLYNDRITYASYWKDEDHLADWAEAELHLLYDIILEVRQNPEVDENGIDLGMDVAQGFRIIKFANLWRITTKHPLPNGKLGEVPITSSVLRPWLGLWTNAPLYYGELIVPVRPSMGEITPLSVSG